VRGYLWVIAIFLALEGLASTVYPDSFSCTGEREGDFCWLKDGRLYATASWHFTGIAPGNWTLHVEGETFDPCEGCGCERDVTLQVFWRENGGPWNWQFLVLRHEEAGVCRATGEIPLRLSGPELLVLVRRAVLCDPFVGFSRSSAYLQPIVVPEVPPPPPPPPLPAPSEPQLPPPSPPLTCKIGTLFTCGSGEVPPGCVEGGLDLQTVPRVSLSESLGPSDAPVLGPGHYVGEISSGDYQDWYRFSVAKGEGFLVYFEVVGDLEVDVHLVHDPCGTDLAVCRKVRGSVILQAPCQAGVECITIPDGLTECFTGPRCGFFLRIVWRSGSGKYFLSILPAEISP